MTDCVGSLLTWGKQTLVQIEEPLFEAQILLAYVLHCDRVKLITWPEANVSAEDALLYRQLVHRRSQGEPMAYLIGEKEFWSQTFLVNPDTLIPRPDTEKLIEVVLEHSPATPLKVVDLGTGSGIIACILALLRPKWQLFGVDISEAALGIAKINGERLQLTNIEWVQSKWLSALGQQTFDLIVSNPPYLRADDVHLQQGSLSYEPLGALVSGKTGYEAYEIIIEQALVQLNKGGRLVLEHGYDQAAHLQILLAEAKFGDIQSFKDLGGNWRVTTATR